MIGSIGHILETEFSAILSIGHDLTCAVMILYLAKLKLGQRKNGNNTKRQSETADN